MRPTGNLDFIAAFRRAEKRIQAFITKHEASNQEDWSPRWVSFRAVVDYCAKLKLPRKSAVGGKRYAYRKLVEAIADGAFTVSGKSRVLMLVSHGGRIFTITPTELLEAREAIEPDLFTSGYLDKCWAPAELIGRWFLRFSIPSPWDSTIKRTLRIPRGHPAGNFFHARDIKIINRALEMRSLEKRSGRNLSIRKAMTEAICEFGSNKNATGAETDRLRAKLRKRLNLRKKNKARAGPKITASLRFKFPDR